MRCILLTAALWLVAAPAFADRWLPTEIIMTNSGSIFIDRDSIKRNSSDRDRISYKIRVESLSQTALAKISGNCSTDGWQFTRNGKHHQSSLPVLSPEVGAQLLQQACSMAPPAPLSRPRISKPRIR